MRVTRMPHGERFELFAMLRRMPAPWALLFLGCMLLVVFEMDRGTGSAPVQHLYYLPIIFAAARFGAGGGGTSALLAIGLYHLANPRLQTFRYGESDLVQIVLFIAVGLVTARLATDAQRLHQLAMTDDLTGLHNLRSFERELARLLRAARETRVPLALLALDVDRLKSLNDRYGHMTGADAVRTVGLLIADWLPPDAAACRYGGDEFIIAVPRCSRTEAIRIADELRQIVSRTAVVLDGVGFPSGTLSVSVGLACSEVGAEDGPGTAWRDAIPGEHLFRMADAELYRAKTSGRNMTCAA